MRRRCTDKRPTEIICVHLRLSVAEELFCQLRGVWMKVAVLLTVLLTASTLFALDMPPDIGAELAAARRAQQKGEELAGKLRSVPAGIESKDLDELIDKRDAAYAETIKLF